MKEEFCIMPENKFYSTTRYSNLHRHEVFFGVNRQKSIKYGLVVFLTPELHNLSKNGVHFNKKFDTYLKKLGQKTAMDYYNWSLEDFMKIFGRSYL